MKLRLFTLLLLFNVCLLLVCTPMSWAQTIRYVRANATGANNGTSWNDAYISLHSALTAAQPNDQIWVAAGTYKPTADASGNANPTDARTKTFVMKNGVALYGGFDGTETQLSQRNWATNVTTLSGDIGVSGINSDNSLHVIENIANGLTNSAILDGFVIADGNANSGGNALQEGGGMRNSQVSPTIANCIFRNNAAGYNGGAISNTSSSPILINCTFYSNSATYSGGAINSYMSSPVIKNCSFSGNVSNATLGVIQNNSSTSTLTNCILWGNSSGIATANGGAAIVTYSIVEGGYSGTGNSSANPLFVSATDLRLQACSPAINAGNNSLLPNDLAEDLAKQPRIFNNGTVDMGAYEYQSAPPTAITPTVSSNHPTTCGGSDGSITLSGFLNNTTYSVAYKKDNNPVAPGNFTSNGSGVIILTGLGAGNYTDIVATYGACVSNASSATLNNPTRPTVSITGANPICVGSTTTLSPTTGGTWASGNTNVATVTNAGVVTGVSGGATTFTFTQTSTGCTSLPTPAVTVNARPTVSITGANPICMGSTTTLSPTTGGTWASGNTNVATVINAGVVTGVSGGTATFTFTQTSTGCTSLPTPAVTVNARPTVTTGAPTQPTTCGGSDGSITLSGFLNNTTYSVAYEKDNNPVAAGNFTSNGSGVITLTGLGAGNYTAIVATYGACVSNAASAMLNDPTPPTATIAGNNSPICASNNATFTVNGTSGATLTYTLTGQAGNQTLLLNGINQTLTATNATANATLSLISVTKDNCPVSLSANSIVTVTPVPTRLYVKATATGANTGLTWADAFTDLQLALNYSCNSNLTEIWVAAGTYKPTADPSGNTNPTDARTKTFVMKNGVAIYGGFNGTETQLSERNWRINATILSGNIGDAGVDTDNTYRVINNNFTSGSPLNNTAILDGFIVEKGYANGGFPMSLGGGMWNANAAPLVRNCVFRSNFAVAGGGMFNADAQPTITNCLFLNNTTTAEGAGIANGGGTASTKIMNCTFYGNTGPNTINNQSSVTITNCIIWGNGGRISGGTVTYSNVQGGFSGTGNLNTDPLFVNAAGGDFRLQQCSPVIDAGTATDAPTNDFGGNNRVDAVAGGGVVDIGAYEYQSTYDACVCVSTSGILYVNASASGDNNGRSWANAFTDLQSALSLARSYPSCVSQIWVAEGTYRPTSGTDRGISFSMMNGVAIYGGFPNTGNPTLTDRNRATNPTILSGNIGNTGVDTDNTYQVINNNFTSGSPLGNTAILDGFIVEKGYANGGFPLSLGGGMWNANAAPLVRNCVFRNNFAVAGGGMFNADAQPTITNCLFLNNTTTDAGAGIANGGGTASTKIINCTFYGNTGLNTINNQSNVTITNSIVWGNGGGISDGTVTYSNVQGGFSGTGNLNIDPRFVNAANGDFRLQQCSPAIDAGTATDAPATDFVGNARVDAVSGGGVVDMGAYEYQSTYDVCTVCANTTTGILYVNASAAGSNNGSSWGNAFTDLQSALSAARSYPSCVSQIWVAKGTYKPTSGTDRAISFEMVNGVAIYGGFAGGEAQLSARNWVANPTILSGDIDGTPDVVTGSGSTLSITGNDGNSYHVIYNNGNGLTSSSILNGFTVRGGNANATSSPNNDGGGMYNNNASPTVVNCKFIYNNASNSGGGAYFNSSNITIDNCSFNLNSSGLGGGFNMSSSSIAVNHCQYTGNRAKTGNGGGINVTGTASLTMSNCQVTENSAISFGGGITSLGVLTILSSQINNNTAANGGGVAQANREFIMNNCEIRNNRTIFQSAGINLQDVSSAILTNCVISGNESQSSQGGISLTTYNATNSQATLINCTVANNKSVNGFGAIWTYVDQSGKTATFTLKNTIVANNPGGNFLRGNQPTNPVYFGTIQSQGNNLDSDGSSGFSNGINGDLVNVDPKFVSSTDLHLQACSPAIDAGTNQGAPTTDFEGNARVDAIAGGGLVDMGAYEYQLTYDFCTVCLNLTGGIVYVNASAAGSNNGSSWANAFTDLQSALSLARANPSCVSQIWVAQGTYRPTSGTDRTISFSMVNGVAIYGGFPNTGNPTMTNRNWAINVTTLSGDIDQNDATAGNANNSYHVIRNGNATDATAILDGFTITAGRADIALSKSGGGVFNDGRNGYCNPTFRYCIFRNNEAGFGGAVSNDGNNGACNPTFTQCSFWQNKAIHNSNISHGGAVEAISNVSITFTHCTFAQNTALADGGALILTNSFGRPQISLRGCIFWGNSASGRGSQIYNYVSTISLQNNLLQGGLAGIANYGNGEITNDLGGNLSTDPLFVDAANGNLQLQVCSPAINTGNNSLLPNGLNEDLAKQPRVFNNGTVDMGAYEYQSTYDVCTVCLNLTGGIVYVNASAVGSNNGSSWANAFTDLQSALSLARANPSCVSQIWVAQGTYRPTSGTDRTISFSMVKGVAIYGGFPNSGEPTMANRNWAANSTILSGDIGTLNNQSDNSYRVVNNNNNELTPANALLDGFTIMGGNATEAANGNYSGAGMTNHSSSPSLSNLIFSNNQALIGGGMYNIYSSPSLTNVTLFSNSATGDGGGIYMFNSNSVLMNVAFVGNQAADGGGLVINASSPTLTNVTFIGNLAANRGGGMFLANASRPILTNVTISGNQATNGGAMFNLTSYPNLKNCILWGNSSEVYNNEYSVPVYSHCLVQGLNPSGEGNLNGTLDTNNPLFVSQPPVGLGTAGDLRLQACSPAINAGNNNLLPNGLTEDLAKQPRIFNNGTVDMGAYEYQGTFDAVAPVAQVTNSVCTTFGGTPLGGLISAPSSSCPAGSTLYYSTDNGSNWSKTLPTYSQAGPAQTILTRCTCDANPATFGPTSTVTTVPGTCPVCPDLTASAPAVQVTNSVCATFGGTPSGGVISAPSGSCPAGSTLYYSTDNGSNWSKTLPTYAQTGPAQTIMTRCTCDANANTSSPTSTVTTAPGVCPGCPVLTSAAPVVQVTNSVCQTGCVIGGGSIAVPSTSCPVGSTLQYQLNGGGWSTTLPTYVQTGPAQTIKTRCVCNSNASQTSPESSVTTIPGTVPALVVPANGSTVVSCPALATLPVPPVVNDCSGAAILPSSPIITNSPDPLTCEGTRTYTYTYQCGTRTASWSFVYTIEREVFTVSVPNGSATVYDASLAVAPTPPKVLSQCGETLVPSAPVITNSPNPLVCEGTRTYTYTYTDCEGNTASWSYVYTILDNSAPTIACPANITACEGQTITFTPPVGTDNCLGAVTTQIAGLPTSSIYPVGITTNMYKVTATNGQSSTCSFTVTVISKPTVTLSLLQQTLNEGNNPTLCDTDANLVNSLQFGVTRGCVVGTPVWRVQVGSGAWSEWSTNPPATQLSNNQPHRYQAACEASCPVTYTSPIVVQINYRSSTPQQVSLVADGVTVNEGESKEVCNIEGNSITFNATCAAGEILLYSVDGGDYNSVVPTQLVDGQYHNYRVRCRKSDGTTSCIESESGVMRLKISNGNGLGQVPVASLNVTSGCGTSVPFSGTASCGSLTTVWYNVSTNVALPTLPSQTPTETTSYYARCQAGGGCLSEKSNVATFTVIPVSVAPVISASQEIVCAGTTVTISANCPAGSQTFWNTGVTTPSFEAAFNNVTKQTYWAKCIFEGGCQSSESVRKDVYWNAFVVTMINVGQSKSAVKPANDKALWSSQFITKDGGPELEQSTQVNPTLYYVENPNKVGPRYWTINVDACGLGTDGSLTFDLLATPETGGAQSFNTHENNAPYFMYANREGWTELYAQNHPAYGFYQDNGVGGNTYDAGLPKGLYKLGIRYWDQKGWGSIYPSTRQPQGNVLAYQEYWFRIQSKDGIGVGAARSVVSGEQGSDRRTAKGKGQSELLSDNEQRLTDNIFAQVMPNPVTNILRLQVQDSKGHVVQTTLTDASGRSVSSRQFVPETNSHQEEFGVSELPSGMYFLKVNTPEKQTTLKVVKVE